MSVSQQLTLVKYAFLVVLNLSGPRNAAGAGNYSGAQPTAGISPRDVGGGGGVPGGAMILHPSYLLRCG